VQLSFGVMQWNRDVTFLREILLHVTHRLEAGPSVWWYGLARVLSFARALCLWKKKQQRGLASAFCFESLHCLEHALNHSADLLSPP